MSHERHEDMDDQRIVNDGPERFSDECAGCGHSRANHLPKGVRTPVSGRECRVTDVHILTLEEVGEDTPFYFKSRGKDDGLVYIETDETGHVIRRICNCMWRAE